MQAGNERGSYAGGVARREAILDAAVSMIAEVGYHGMSMRDIARRVGISHPGVIYHFPSKEALMMAVIERYEDGFNFDIQALATMPPFEVFYNLVHLAAELSKNPTIVEMECILAVEASNEIHPAHDHFVARFNDLQKCLARAYRKLDEQGILLRKGNPDILGQALVSQWYGLQIQWLYNRETLDVEGPLTASIIGQVDLDNPETLSGIMSSRFATPAAMNVIEEITGLTLEDLLDQGYINLSATDMDQYGLAQVPAEILEKIMRSGVLNAKDLEYAQANKALSIDLLGRMIVNHVLETPEYETLAQLDIVPKEAVAAMQAVMAARPI